MKPASELTSIQRTALIPLACRALAHINHEFADFSAPEAVAVCNELNVDLRRFGGSRIARKALVLRSIWFERQISSTVLEVSADNSPWQVINIAAGFDTTAFKFLANENVSKWLDADAPDVNRIKQSLTTFTAAKPAEYQIVDCELNKTEHFNHLLAESSLTKHKSLIIMQGISMYLSRDIMQRLLMTIHNATRTSRDVRILIDWCSPILNRFSFVHPAFLQARIFNVRLDWSLSALCDITSHLPGFEYVTTEDPIYSQTSASTRACKLLYERILRRNSPGIYGCSVFRRRDVE